LLRPRSRALAFASSAVFALVLASTLGAANGTDSDRDGVSDQLEDNTQRDTWVWTRGDVFNVSSSLGAGPVRDQFEFWYWPGHFGVWYGVEDGPSVRFEVEMRSLLVWNDQDADGQIAFGEIRRAIPLGSAAFDGVGVSPSERRDSDGGRVYNFAVVSSDRAVSFNITLAQRFTRLHDMTLTPMEARMDVRLQPVISDPTASVALEFHIETGGGDVRFENRSWDEEKQFAPGEHAMTVTEGEGERTASAFFSWGNDAVVSGQTVTVDPVDQKISSNRYNLSFAYPAEAPQGLVVVHQMAFGIRSLAYDSIERQALESPPLQPDLYLFTGTFAGVAGLLAATVFLSNRRRLRHKDESRKP